MHSQRSALTSTLPLMLLAVALVGCGDESPAALPSATDVAISPAAARLGDTLSCDYAFDAPSGGGDDSTIQWFVNDAEAGTGSTLMGGLAGGDEVRCEVTPASGEDVGDTETADIVLLHGGISGSVFHDLNQDGVWNMGEPGIEGRTLFLDANGNGVLDGGEPSVLTDADGAYLFDDVMPGSVAVAQQAGMFAQTDPRVVATYTDDFGDGMIDPALWATTGDGITEGSGVLTMDRDAAIDSVAFLPAIGGSVHFSFSIRNVQMHWKDMFHGFAIHGPCDMDRDVTGTSFGFSRYGNFFQGSLGCGGTGYDYPGPFVSSQWYTFDVVAAHGAVSVKVDGMEVATGEAAYDDLMLELPGPYTDGGEETNTISEVDNFVLEVLDFTHTVSVTDGVVSADFDFGTDS